jgi:uncharacterized protein
MALSEKINDDLKIAMKSGDSIKLNTIRSIRTRIIELSKRGTGSNITTEDELTILLSEAKKRKEAIEMYQKAGRSDLSDQEQRELEIINEYLPKQMSREEAGEIIKKIIQEVEAVSAKDFGKVMPAAMKELKGKVDGKIVQDRKSVV